MKDAILRYKSRIWIGQDSALHKQLISALHDAPVGGHFGFSMTYSRIKKLFVWKGMKNDVKSFVQQCQVCLQSKPDRASYPGKFQPLSLIEPVILVNSNLFLWHQRLGKSYPLIS
jgi:hypothetical protein